MEHKNGRNQNAPNGTKIVKLETEMFAKTYRSKLNRKRSKRYKNVPELF